MRRWLIPLFVLASCGDDEPRPLRDLDAFKVSSTRRENQQWLAVKNGKGLGEPRAYIRRETLLFPDGSRGTVDTVYDLHFNEKAKIGADGRVLTNRKNRRTQEWEEVDLGRMGLPRAVGVAMDWPRGADKDFSIVPMTLEDTRP
ncbi:MAG: hypothetical protein AB7F75_01775 [Planctomycetota bacterium]